MGPLGLVVVLPKWHSNLLADRMWIALTAPPQSNLASLARSTSKNGVDLCVIFVNILDILQTCVFKEITMETCHHWAKDHFDEYEYFKFKIIAIEHQFLVQYLSH